MGSDVSVLVEENRRVLRVNEQLGHQLHEQRQQLQQREQQLAAAAHQLDPHAQHDANRLPAVERVAFNAQVRLFFGARETLAANMMESAGHMREKLKNRFVVQTDRLAKMFEKMAKRAGEGRCYVDERVYLQDPQPGNFAQDLSAAYTNLAAQLRTYVGEVEAEPMHLMQPPPSMPFISFDLPDDNMYDFVLDLPITQVFEADNQPAKKESRLARCPEEHAWRVSLRNVLPETLANFGGCIVAVMGEYGRGKTYFLDMLSRDGDTRVIPESGEFKHTRGLSFKFHNLAHNNCLLLDTAGMNAPVDFQRQGVGAFIRNMGDVDRVLSTAKQQDAFYRDCCVVLSDFVFIVVNGINQTDMQLVTEVARRWQLDSGNMARTRGASPAPIVIHNIRHAKNEAQLLAAFEEVQTVFAIETLRSDSKLSPEEPLPVLELNNCHPKAAIMARHILLADNDSKWGAEYNKRAIAHIRAFIQMATSVQERTADWVGLQPLQERLSPLVADAFVNCKGIVLNPDGNLCWKLKPIPKDPSAPIGDSKWLSTDDKEVYKSHSKQFELQYHRFFAKGPPDYVSHVQLQQMKDTANMQERKKKMKKARKDPEATDQAARLAGGDGAAKASAAAELQSCSNCNSLVLAAGMPPPSAADMGTKMLCSGCVAIQAMPASANYHILDLDLGGCLIDQTGIVKWKTTMNSPNFSIEAEGDALLSKEYKVVIKGRVKPSAAPWIVAETLPSRCAEGYFEERFELPRQASVNDMLVDLTQRLRFVRVVFRLPDDKKQSDSSDDDDDDLCKKE